MRQLCRHFGHKTEAEFGETDDYIVIAGCRCDLDATTLHGRRDELTVTWDA